MATSPIIWLLLCICSVIVISASIYLGLWATNTICNKDSADPQHWIGIDCPSVYNRPEVTADTVKAAGQAILTTEIETGATSPTKTAFTPFTDAEKPTGYTPGSPLNYTMSFDIKIAAGENMWRHVFAHNELQGSVGVRKPAVYIVPDNNLEPGQTDNWVKQAGGSAHSVQVYGTGADFALYTPSLPIDGTTWTNIAWSVKDGLEFKLYMNGVLQQARQLQTASNWPSPDVDWVWLGGQGASSQKVKNIYFWPTVLSESEIAVLGTTSTYTPEPLTMGTSGYTKEGYALY